MGGAETRIFSTSALQSSTPKFMTHMYHRLLFFASQDMVMHHKTIPAMINQPPPTRTRTVALDATRHIRLKAARKETILVVLR